MKKSNIRISYNKLSGNYKITNGDFEWVSAGRKPYIILRKKAGKKYVYTYRLLTSALKKEVEYFDNKIICRFSDYIAFGKKLPFKLVCTAKTVGENSVEFTLKAENETDLDIVSVYFPSPFNSKKRCENSYAVEPIRQGLIMPDGYNKNFLSTFALTKYWRKINTGDWYHNFFGRVCGSNGYCAVVETPYDADGFSCFSKGRAFLTGVNWRSSLGKLSYTRKITYHFLNDCDYNDIAKTFRKHLKSSGGFVSIDDKIKQNSNVSKLIGVPVLHHRILTNVQPKSKFYKKNGKNKILYASFQKRANQLEKIKELGLEGLYIHTDGWGVAGYDNKHPYVLPPNEEAGGFDGMRALSDTCKKLGYSFGIHDQYRDYYYDCEKFDDDLSVMKIDGTHPYCDIWDGGAHTWLCAYHALPFVKNTYEQLKNNGVNIDGSYLDVFAVMSGDECFNPKHKITRQKSIYYRGKCFDYLRENGIITSSEEGASLLLNKLDLVHHSPHQVRPQGGGKAVGIPVPLTSLIYHDCVFVPWISSGKGGWGIPDNDSARLYCILHSGTPYFYPFKFNGDTDEIISESELKKEIENVKELCDIQKRLYNKEMISHKFLDTAYKKQQVVYSDGTIITVDFKNDTYDIKWGNNNS